MVCCLEHAFKIGVLRKDTWVKSFCNCNCTNHFVVWCGHMSCVFWWQWCCQNMPNVSYMPALLCCTWCVLHQSSIVRGFSACISRLDSNPWNWLDYAGHRCAACFDVFLASDLILFFVCGVGSPRVTIFCALV